MRLPSFVRKILYAPPLLVVKDILSYARRLISRFLLRVKASFYAIKKSYKLRLLFSSFFDILPYGTIKWSLYRFPYYVASMLTRNCIINVDGIKYFLVDSGSLITVLSNYEAEVLKFLKLQEGDVFLDIGAHIASTPCGLRGK